MNIWESLLYFLLDRNIRKADQFTEKEFVEELFEELSDDDSMIVGALRSCRWRADCYEVDVAVKGKAQISTTLGPQIPLINEYRSAIRLFPAGAQLPDLLFYDQRGRQNYRCRGYAGRNLAGNGADGP